MKRIISTVLVCVLLLGCVFSLASCAKKISGTYEGKLEILGQSYSITYTFSGSKVEAKSKLSTILGDSTESATGTYEITEDEDGKMKIAFDFEEDGVVFRDCTATFEEGEDFIKLDGLKFSKVEK